MLPARDERPASTRLAGVDLGKGVYVFVREKVRRELLVMPIARHRSGYGTTAARDGS